jgi:hypothetical protein
MARRNGRSYVVKGETPKRYWEPSQGDVVYIEGTRTKLGKPWHGEGGTVFPLKPPVRGTTAMSQRNIKAVARVEEGKGMESVGSTATFSRRPNPRQRKTRDVWVVQGNYGYGHGWEDVTAEETWKEIRQRVKEYRENEPGTPFRVKLTREKIETGQQNPTRTSGTFMYEIYNPKTGETLGRSFPSKREANQFIRYLKSGTSLKLHWKARKTRTGNPAGPSAIPAKWTPATVSRKGGQIQIRMGGR